MRRITESNSSSSRTVLAAVVDKVDLADAEFALLAAESAFGASDHHPLPGAHPGEIRLDTEDNQHPSSMAHEPDATVRTDSVTRFRTRKGSRYTGALGPTARA